MSDIVIPPEEEFETQAKLHDSIRDSLHTFVSSFDPHHNTVIDHLDKDQIEHYTQWWQKLRKALLAHADAHDKLGQHLRTAKQSYYTLEGQLTTSMTPKS
jgi:hypothetical protein